MDRKSLVLIILANWLVIYVSCCVLQEFFTFLSLIIYFFLTMCLIFIFTCSFMCLVFNLFFYFVGLIIPGLLISCVINDVCVFIIKIKIGYASICLNNAMSESYNKEINV